MSRLVNLKFRATIAATLFVVASLSASQAQTNHELRATVPFAFQYGSHHYAAGQYSVRMLSDRFVVFQSKSSSGMVMVEPSYGRAATTGKLVFNRYGNRYFLEQIWTPNADAHLDCIQTTAEQRIRRELTFTSNAVPTVTRELALTQAAR